MKWLKIKQIKMEIDDRKTNILAKNVFGQPVEFKQSKCTCRFILSDNNGEEYCWVATNESLATALELIAENEDKKYDIANNPHLLGRNMVFLAWLYWIWKNYLDKHGFNPPQEHLEKANKFKRGKT